MGAILSAREIGEGLPVLIVHGWQSDGRVEEADFEPIFTRIQGILRIYVDLPGMGSTPANDVKNQDDMYHRLLQYVDARLGKSKFLLVGSSCGGYLARALALRYADQVDGLLLRVPLIEPSDSLRDLDPFTPLVANDELMSTMPIEDKNILGNIPIQTPAYVKALKMKYDQVFLPAERTSDSKVLNPIRENPDRYRLSLSLDREDAQFHAPTLIVCGRHDETVGYRDSLRLLKLYPRSTYIVLDRGTHALPVDENVVFQALVNDWIARVNEWRNQVNSG